MSVHMEQGVTT